VAIENEKDASRTDAPEESDKEPEGRTSTPDIHLPPLEDPPEHESKKSGLLEEVCDLTLSASPTFVRNTLTRGEGKEHN
jgi:hypothetical protein